VRCVYGRVVGVWVYFFCRGLVLWCGRASVFSVESTGFLVGLSKLHTASTHECRHRVQALQSQRCCVSAPTMLRNCASDWKTAAIVGSVGAVLLAATYPLTQESTSFSALPPPGAIPVFWNCGFLTQPLPPSAASTSGSWWESAEAATWQDGSARWIRLDAHGPWLHARCWGPGHFTPNTTTTDQKTESPASEPRATVLLVHGYAEHSSRPGYDAFARYLVRALGVRVYTIDNRGFGRSQGERAFAVHYDEVGFSFHVMLIDLSLYPRTLELSLSLSRSLSLSLVCVSSFVFCLSFCLSLSLALSFPCCVTISSVCGYSSNISFSTSASVRTPVLTCVLHSHPPASLPSRSG
jgi:Serine aminopeptidase, S33